jgi:hypothetical protein
MSVPRRADGPERPAVPNRDWGAPWSLVDAWRAFAREVGVPRRRRPLDPQTRRRAFAAAIGAVLVFVALVVVPGARAATVSTGNVTSISLDNTSAVGGGNACTALTSSVVVTETGIGNLVAGRTLTLTLPSGFAFCGDAFAIVSSTTTGATGLTLSQSIATLSTDLTTLTTTIASASTGTVPGRVTFSGAFVKPTGTVPTSGTLAIGGTAGASGTGDTIRSTVGSVAQVLFSQSPAGGGVNAGAVMGTQPIIVAKDRFGNVRSGDSFALTIESGPAGASLACSSNTTVSLGSGASYATFSGCSVDRSGTYRLRATVSTAFTISSEFTVGAVAPTGAVVKATTDVNAASYISGNSKAAVSVDVTFPTGGPRESGTVTVTLASGGSSVAGSTSVTSTITSVTVSGINTTSLPDGPITVAASFTGGATSAVASGTPATKDTTAPILDPSLPSSTVVLRLATASDSGTFGDGVTNVTAPSFTVSNVTDGTGTGIDTVYVQVKPTGGSYAISGSGVTSATGGIYTVTAATLADGAYDVQARVVDKAGNSATFPLSPVNGVASTLTIDTTAPTATLKYASYADGGIVPSVDSGYSSTLTTAVNGTRTVAVQVTFAAVGLSGTPTFTFRAANGISASVTASESSAGSGIWREAFDVGSSTADGSVTVSMAGVTDAAGNAAVFASGQTTTFTVDNTGPTFSVGYSRASPMGGGNLTITVTSNESLQANPTVVLTKGAATSSFAVTPVSGSTTKWDGSYSVPSSGGDGTVTVAVTGTDTAGNLGNQVVSGGSFVIDTAAPNAATVRQTSDDSGPSKTDGITTVAPVFEVTLDADATANVAVSKDGTTFALQAGLATIIGTGNPVTWTPKGSGGAALTNGTYVFTFTVSDGAGNPAASATSKTVTLDLVPPVATMVTPTLGSYLNDPTPDFVATVTDGGGIDSLSFEIKGPSASDFTTAGSATLATGTVASGTWQLTSTTLVEGLYEVRAFATDFAGNTNRSATSSFTIDVTLPERPTGVGLTAATDTGASNTDGITNAVTQAITGVAEAYSSVALFDGNAAITGATATVTPATVGATTGTFTIATALATGTHSITATATDRAGNASNPSTPATVVVVDRTAPTTGAFALRVADDGGSSASDGILNVATPTFTVTGPSDSGYTGAGIASVKVETSVDNGGTWTARGTSANTSSPYTIEAAGLTENIEYRVRAAIMDVAGNVATVDLPTSNGRIKIDVTAPVAGSLAIVENEGKANDGVIKAASATFGLTGASDPYSGIASVQLQDATAGCLATGFTATGTPVTTIVGGAATLQTGTLTAGTYSVCAVVTDVAGNVATTATGTFTIDTTAPTPGTIAVVDADGTANDGIVKTGAPTFQVTGASDSGYTVPVTARVMQVQLEVAAGAGQSSGFALTGLAVTNSTSGTFSAVPSTLANGTYTVRARVTDLAGNDAWTPGVDVTVDTTAPTPGTLALVDTDGVTSDGVVYTATPNFTVTGATDSTYTGTGAPTAGVASVQLQVANGANGTAFVDRGTPTTAPSGGVFTVVSDALASGQYVSRAVVTDRAGNSATTATSSFVVDLGPPTVTVSYPTASLAVNTATPTFAAHATDAGTGVASVTFEVAPSGVSPTFVSACIGSKITGTTADGNWWCAPVTSIGSDGDYLVQAVATDVAGNVATATFVAFTVDTVPPVAPTNVGLSSSTDLGSSSTDAITKVSAVTVTGTAEAGSTVRVYDTDGTTELGSVTLASGSATFAVAVTLTEGTHQVTATATDAAGNVSPASAALPTTIDLTAPTVALTYSPSRPVKSGDTLTVTATASETLGAAPVISIRSGDVGDGPMTGSGTTWTYVQTVDGGNGTANVTLTGTDVAGNALSVTSGASYVVDNVAPRLATVTTSGTAYNGTASVAFTATFSEAVTGVTAADFVVDRGLGVGGVLPVVAGVTGSGTTWTVTVTTAGASGSGDSSSTLGIRLDPTTMASIVDVALNQVAIAASTGTSATYVMGPAPTPGPSAPPAATATLAPTATAMPTATVAPVVPIASGGAGGSGGGASGGASTGTGTGGATNATDGGGSGRAGGAVDAVIGPVQPLPDVGFPDVVATSRSLSIAISSVPGGASSEVVRGVAAALSAVPEEAARGFAASIGAYPKETAGAIVGAIGTVPASSARTFVETIGSIPAGETWQVGSVLGSLPAVQGAAIVGAVGSLPIEQARTVVQVLSVSPPQALVTLAAFVSGQSSEQSARTMASISSYAQAGTPVTIAAPYGSSVTASGREIVSFVVPADSPPTASRQGAAEVAGAKSQGTPSRTVVVLARPGQAARVVRYEAGPWPLLALPLGNRLSGAIPLVNLPDSAMALTFDPAPSNLNAVQKGSLGGGIVTPLGSPFTLDVDAPDEATIGLSFPSIAVPTDASLGYLYETRDGGGNFVGYLRAPTTFVPLTGRQDWSLTAAELRATLVLPVALRPAYVANFVPGLRIWSGPYEGAKDFGPADPLLTTYTVVAPQVGDRIYVLNEATKNYGWIDATGVAPTGPPE